MRLALLVLLALAAGAGATHAGELVLHRQSDAPGWFREAFSTNEPTLRVLVGSHGDGELVGHIVNLYDGAGAFLGGATVFGAGGDPLDLVVRSGDARVSAAALPLEEGGHRDHSLAFECDAACNPGRSFQLVVTAGGDFEAWGFALFGKDVQLGESRNGSSAHALSTADFDGTLAHATLQTSRGAVAAVGATSSARADDAMVATFARFSGTPFSSISASTPAGDARCPCVLPRGAPGDYVFRQDGLELNGQTVFLAWADVPLE